MESILTDLMFEAPSDNTIERITITSEAVENPQAAFIERSPQHKPAKISLNSKNSDKKHIRRNPAS